MHFWRERKRKYGFVRFDVLISSHRNYNTHNDTRNKLSLIWHFDFVWSVWIFPTLFVFSHTRQFCSQAAFINSDFYLQKRLLTIFFMFRSKRRSNLKLSTKKTRQNKQNRFFEYFSTFVQVNQYLRPRIVCVLSSTRPNFCHKHNDNTRCCQFATFVWAVLRYME